MKTGIHSKLCDFNLSFSQFSDVRSVGRNEIKGCARYFRVWGVWNIEMSAWLLSHAIIWAGREES